MFKRKSACQRSKEMLSLYIDGKLGPSERERIESHIEGCQACRRELESLEATVNLLHRVAMVSSPRSFALAEVAPKRRPVAFGALRAATAVAVLLLAFLFLGDALNLFQAGLIEERFAQQVTPTAGEVLDTEGMPAQGEGYAWPVRQLELALLGVVVVLAGTTAILWQRRRRGAEEALKGRF
ncbi:MAG: anti-sigma factor family protein [Dehalococcoidia bacterium]